MKISTTILGTERSLIPPTSRGTSRAEEVKLDIAKFDKVSQMRVTKILTKLGCKKIGRRMHQNKKQHVWAKVAVVTENGKNNLSTSQPSYQPHKGWYAPEKESGSEVEQITSQPVPTFSLYKGITEITQTYTLNPDSLAQSINQPNEVVTNSLIDYLRHQKGWVDEMVFAVDNDLNISIARQLLYQLKSQGLVEQDNDSWRLSS